MCFLSGVVRADESFSCEACDPTQSCDSPGTTGSSRTRPPCHSSPASCFWNPANVRSDDAGLPLSVDKAPSGAWMSSEVMIDTSFGSRPIPHGGPRCLRAQPNPGQVIFAAFIWDETNAAHWDGEIDIIEASRFGDPFQPSQRPAGHSTMEHGRPDRQVRPAGRRCLRRSSRSIRAASDIVFRVENPDAGFAVVAGRRPTRASSRDRPG